MPGVVFRRGDSYLIAIAHSRDVPEMRIRLIWWNVQDFAHYDLSRIGEVQWPSSAAAFDAKADLLAAVLREHTSTERVIVALAETTRRAAEALRDRILPAYRVLS